MAGFSKLVVVVATLSIGIGLAIIGWTAEDSVAQGDGFTVVVLPDTQKYARTYTATFRAQTQWIVDNLSTLNIQYVVHEGDIVDTYDSTAQWDVADVAMGLLEDPVTTGLEDGIPYGVVPGNHDNSYGNDGTYFNTYFGPARFAGRSYYGGYHGTSNENNYTLFSAGGIDYIVLNLTFQPDSAELTWADGLLAANPDRWAIVVSHQILKTTGEWDGQGKTIYDTLKGNANLFLMLCGHNHGEARRSDTYEGRVVNTLLADYQSDVNGGNGWLRILEFAPGDNEVRVKTYSPTLDDFDGDATSQFTLGDVLNGTEPPISTVVALPIVAGDGWSYFKGVRAPGVGWNDVGFDAAGWLEGEAGIGYGDGDDATVLTDMQYHYVSVYARRLFTVDNPGDVSSLMLSMDFDDGFVAYINGIEVARENLMGETPVFSTTADSGHEAGEPKIFKLGTGSLVTGTNVLAVQAHNVSMTSSDLSLLPELMAVRHTLFLPVTMR